MFSDECRRRGHTKISHVIEVCANCMGAKRSDRKAVAGYINLAFARAYRQLTGRVLPSRKRLELLATLPPFREGGSVAELARFVGKPTGELRRELGLKPRGRPPRSRLSPPMPRL